MTLADSYNEVNDLKQAKANWKKVKEVAINVGNQDIAAECSAALAEIYQKERGFKLSDKELKLALRNKDDPKSLALILLRRIDVLLEKKKENEAHRIFEKIRTITEEHGLKGLYVNLHMKFGDYYWDKGYSSQFNAMQAYTVAMLKAIEFDIKTFLQVGSHIFGIIYTIESNKRIARIDAFIKGLSRWLVKQLGKADPGLITKWALWPLRVARKLSTASQRKNKLTDQKIKQMIESELYG